MPLTISHVWRNCFPAIQNSWLYVVTDLILNVQLHPAVYLGHTSPYRLHSFNSVYTGKLYAL
jgi:hypothetical protein